MMIHRLNTKGQNIAEYAVVVGLVGSVLVAMSIFFQRSIKVVIRAPVDNLGAFDSGLFRPQRIQEMGIEKYESEDLPFVEPLSTASFSILNAQRNITTFSGGGRTSTPNQHSESGESENQFTRIKYDQVTR